MAEYKKRTVKGKKRSARNTVTVQEIPMKPQPARKARAEKDVKSNEKIEKQAKSKQIEITEDGKRNNIKVIRGNKNKKNIRRLTALGIAALLVIAVIAMSIILPTGIAEYLLNAKSLIGSGSGYPASLSGGTVTDVQTAGNYYIVASSTNVEGYNANGKNIFSYRHGYEIPILKKSSSRFMLYSQGSTEFMICTLYKNLISGKTDSDILCADISDSGYYAIATQSDSYSSEVTVYNAKNDVVYQWFCSDYIINDVVLSADGKTIAVSVFNAKDGVYFSKIYILRYSSADPLKTFEYNDKLILSLRSYGRNGFWVIFNNESAYISWGKLLQSNQTYEKNVIFARGDSSYSVIATCRNANLSDNSVYIYAKNGTQKHIIEFDGEISDIAIRGKYVYILSGRTVYLYNSAGELLNQAECDFGVERLAPLSNLRAALVTDNKIQKIVF